MFERKLTALNYPSEGIFDVNGDTVKKSRVYENQFRHIILWLEEQKIRHYKIEDREPLRLFHSNEWIKAYKQYKDDLACPIVSGKLAEEMDWLLSYAIRLEYLDDVDKFKNLKMEKQQAVVPQIISSNPLDNLDFHSPDFKAGVNALAKLLNITCHPDHLITLKAVSKVVAARLTPEALENPHTVIIKVRTTIFLQTTN
ncbi:hypothetical protein B566_EDAN006412 [Ephemera danica]|nr:hypothetical protein B566_EDAN006412 [Ephemera danica]